MKRTFKYIIGITCSLAAVFSCARFDEQSVPEKGKMEHVVFTAVIEGGEQTKTVLGGEMGDEYRQVLWQPQDSVGICSSDWWYTSLNKFVNTETEESETASLEGEIDNGFNYYYAFYPFTSDLFYYDSAKIRFVQPSVQTYGKNTFNANAMPMVARAARNEVFQFYSLCGVLAVNLTGSETVKSISFSGYDAAGVPMPVAGHFDVNMGYEAYPEMVPSTYNESCYTVSSVTLDCGEGVALNAANPTAFYIVLPVGTYNTFTITVATTDGKLMLKEGVNPLNIRRANVTKAGSLVFVEDVTFDLSEHGSANSYIVTEPGLYSIKADVIGNGGYGIIEGAGFHTDDPFISPSSAKLIWEDRSGVINNVNYADGELSFMAPGMEGNALVGVVDQAGNILWSWHIWVTDQPQEQTYIKGEDRYVMLDRNLGAVRADRGSGEEWKDAVGLLYQWGRKDPFTFRYVGVTDYHSNRLYTTDSQNVSLSTAVANPTVFYGAGYYYWSESVNTSLWKESQKTIYDPCPVGYKVPHREVWTVFVNDGGYYYGADGIDSMNVSGSYDQGYNLIYDGTNTAYYPSRAKIDNNGNLEAYNSNHTSNWSASGRQDNELYSRYMFKTWYYTRVDSWLHMDHTNYMTAAHAVRCMKDEGYVDAAKPLVRAVGSRDVTEDGVTLEAKVIDEGSTPVVERGIIWGKTNDLSLENGNVAPAEGGGLGDFTVTVTGLEPSTKYYYKAYAKNAEYTSYSESKYFYTPYEGNVFNLSQEGTANCYIVPPVYAEYAFNATVKGNSKEAVGTIASAEVLWETTLKHDDIQVNDIISEVSVNGNNVHFLLAPEAKEGNALIAVKDAEGTILWSWHIWVVDFDPVATQQKYQSGAIMMDRNLGATSVIPDYQGAETTDYSAYGLYYQWGRKDPFPYLGSIVPLDVVQVSGDSYTVDHSVQNPTVASDMWSTEDDLWDSSKTMYDPCPAGWRVPDPSAWNGWINQMVNAGYKESYKSVMSPYSTPMAYYPNSDRVEGYSNWPNALNDNILIWSTNRNQDLYSHSGWDTFEFSNWGDNCRIPVRCMKEQDVESGDNEGYTGSDYEW